MHINTIDVLLFLDFILDRTNFAFAFALEFEVIVVLTLVVYLLAGGCLFEVDAVQNLVVVVFAVFIGMLGGVGLFKL
jgi:hypothetical protein